MTPSPLLKLRGDTRSAVFPAPGWVALQSENEWRARSLRSGEELRVPLEGPVGLWAADDKWFLVAENGDFWGPTMDGCQNLGFCIVADNIWHARGLLARSPDGQVLASVRPRGGLKQPVVELWLNAPRSPLEVRRMPVADRRVVTPFRDSGTDADTFAFPACIAWTSDGARLVVIDNATGVHTWTRETQATDSHDHKPDGQTHWGALHPSGKYVVVFSGGKIEFVSIATEGGEVPHSWSEPAMTFVPGGEFTSDGRHLVFTWDHGLSSFTFDGRSYKPGPAGDSSSASPARVSPDGEFILVPTSREELSVYHSEVLLPRPR